jgi:urease accessory protein
MLTGYALGLSGFPVPGVEPAIAVSVLVLGLAITTGRKAAAPASALVIGLFAVFHGAAHGAELPPHAGPFAYAIGFACTSVLLQLCGAALATWSRVGIRVAGVPIAAAGCWMLMQGML